MKFRVKYFEAGQSHEGTFVGSAQNIRVRLTKDGKTVLGMKRIYTFHSAKKRNAEVILTLKALSDLYSVGVPLAKAIETVANSLGKDSEIKGVLVDMKRRADDGDDFSKVLESHKDVFSGTITSMVKSGYETGELAATLKAAAKFMGDMDSANGEMRKKLTYPITVLVIGAILLLADTFFLIPMLLKSDMFRMVVKGGEDASIQALRIISVVVPSLFGVLFLLGASMVIKHRKNPELMEQKLVRMPVLGELLFYRQFFISFFSLANLIESGVRLDEALEIVRSATDSKIIKREYTDAIKYLRDGDSFAKGFKHLSNIEYTMLEISVNEDKLRDNFRIIANRFYDSYMERIRGIGPRIHAIVMIFVAIIFILMAYAVLVPYSKVLGGIG